jgi:rhodanese-related sulfurtransferase
VRRGLLELAAAVSLCKFIQILAITLALSAYGVWLRGERRESGSTPMIGGILLYRLAEAEALWQDPGTRFVDTRTSYAYACGHIAGALELPENEFEQRFPSLRPQLEKATTIIVYCDNRECARSLRVAIRLREAGLSQTQICPAGWNEWFERNLPSEHTATR